METVWIHTENTIHNYNKARVRLQCTSEPHRDELAEEKHSIAYSNMNGNEKRCKG